NLDNSSNLLSEANKQNMLNLFHQVLLREHQRDDLLVINSRAFSYKADTPLPDADILFSTSLGLAEPNQFGTPERKLFGILEMDGMAVQLVNGSEETLGYEQNFSIQARYLNATENKRFVTLWLSPFARAHFRQQHENAWQLAQFQALNVPSEEREFSEYLQNLSPRNAAPAITNKLKGEIKRYTENQNIVQLQQLLDLIQTNGFRLSRLIDANTKQSFLLIHEDTGRLIAVANIGTANDREFRLDFQRPINPQLTAYVQQRAFWLDLDVGAN
ncbi:MAG: hypothetical protein LUQ11_13190, partial [Methylococcaceae bacterium]|nr:hypothetical protein [Methylococcaceae bacterium]